MKARKLLMFIPYYLLLRRLIRVNFANQYASDRLKNNLYSNKFYWIDRLCCNCGYATKDTVTVSMIRKAYRNQMITN